jgi:hypothetical protein
MLGLPFESRAISRADRAARPRQAARAPVREGRRPAGDTPLPVRRPFDEDIAVGYPGPNRRAAYVTAALAGVSDASYRLAQRRT